MPTQRPFQIKDWIDTNCVGASDLRPETVEAVFSFTVMWNFFEGKLCQGDRDIRDSFRRVAQEYAQRVSLSDEIEFWSGRYLKDSSLDPVFEDLSFRPNDGRAHVEAVLRREKTDSESRILAVMFIVYRLRNNLFHGLKEINSWNSQVPNLLNACQSLALILTASGEYAFSRARA